MSYLIALVLLCTACGLVFAALSLLISVLGGAQFVRTPDTAFAAILKAANLQPHERLIEPGCGTGRFLAYVAKHSRAHAHGVELSPLLYARTQWRARHIPGMTAELGNLLTANYRTANVVYCYLLPPLLAKLYPLLRTQLPKGARLVSYAFPVPSIQPTHSTQRTPDFAPIHTYQF